jgi:hypothetical protein
MIRNVFDIDAPRSPLAGLVELEPFGHSPEVFRSFVIQNVVITAWIGTATLSSLASYERLCAQCRERFPRGMSAVQIVSTSRSQLPDTAVRDELTRINSAYSDIVAGCAIVITSQGFLASALRGLVTALMLRLERPRGLEIKIHKDFEGAADWLSPLHRQRTGVSIERDALLQALYQANALAA